MVFMTAAASAIAECVSGLKMVLMMLQVRLEMSLKQGGGSGHTRGGRSRSGRQLGCGAVKVLVLLRQDLAAPALVVMTLGFGQNGVNTELEKRRLGGVVVHARTEVVVFQGRCRRLVQ